MDAIVCNLYSKSLNKYYVGSTTEPIEVRLRKCISEHRGFTAKAKDWKIEFTKSYPSKSEAYQRELEIKKWKSRKLIQDLIKKNKD